MKISRQVNTYCRNYIKIYYFFSSLRWSRTRNAKALKPKKRGFNFLCDRNMVQFFLRFFYQLQLFLFYLDVE